MDFQLVAPYSLSGISLKAIEALVQGVNDGVKEQVFVRSNVTGVPSPLPMCYCHTGRPTLVLAQ